MKSAMIIIAVTTVFMLGLLGYGLAKTVPSDLERQERFTALAPPDEQKPIKTDILNNPAFAKLNDLRIYGKFPVGPDPRDLNRPNPFQNL